MDKEGGKDEILKNLRKNNLVAFPEKADSPAGSYLTNDANGLSRIEQLKANSNAFAQAKQKEMKDNSNAFAKKKVMFKECEMSESESELN